MTGQYYIACDLGAESGRVILGCVTDGRITLEEIHRFPNRPVGIRGTLRVNLMHLYEEVIEGLRMIASRGIRAAGISCDSWGVDYVLLYQNEPLLSLPYHYRDDRCAEAFAGAGKSATPEEIFSETGVQLLPFNTLYQMSWDVRNRPVVLTAADRFLNIGDYFNYLLSGNLKSEESLASTTQLYNPSIRGWSKTLIGRFGIPEHIFPDIVRSGTRLGPLLPDLAAATGLHGVEVVATCSHDTEAAVVAAPAEGDDWAYLSSGTWSLLGVQTAGPIITEKSRTSGFSNEIGVGRSVCFLKNLTGLWILQECRRAWSERGEHYDYDQLTRLAEAAPPHTAFIDPAEAMFASPGDMPQKIADFCRATSQSEPMTPGEVTRCVLESLALQYRSTVGQLEELTGKRIRTLNVLGGGSRSRLLNQWTADATGLTVLAGPAEATAAGNVMVQAIALGQVPSLKAARQIVRASFEPVRSVPGARGPWDEAYRRFLSLAVSGKTTP